MRICSKAQLDATVRTAWHTTKPTELIRWAQVLTAGYTPWVVLLVMNYAFAGIATSAVLKYLDNMTKTFAANAAMFVVAIVAIVFYDEKPTAQLFVGMILAAIAVETYQLHGAPSLLRKYVPRRRVPGCRVVGERSAGERRTSPKCAPSRSAQRPHPSNAHALLLRQLSYPRRAWCRCLHRCTPLE
jgi:hypothetical protein